VAGDFALDGETGVVQKGAPGAEPIAADVGRVAQFFDVLELRVEVFVFRTVVVDDGDAAAVFRYAGHLADGGGVVGEVVRGEADGDDVEFGGGEGERLGGALFCGDVGEATLGGVFRGFGEHGAGEVVGDDALHMGREGERCMAGSGGDVEDCVGGLWRGEGDEGVESGPIAVAGARGVGGGGRGELGTDFVVDFVFDFVGHRAMLAVEEARRRPLAEQGRTATGTESRIYFGLIPGLIEVEPGLGSRWSL